MSRSAVLSLLLGLLCFLSGPAFAQEDPEPAEPTGGADPVLKVAVSPFVPFAILDDEMPRGYSIDLWAGVAREMGVSYDLVEYAGVAEKLQALEQGEVDVVIGGVTLTSDREERFDFSLPCFRTGLDIMASTRHNNLAWSAVSSLFAPGRVGIIVGFIVLVVLSGHIIWGAERGRDAFNDRYIPGVFEGMYWAVVTASTVGYGDKAPARWWGRIVACAVIVISLPLFALFTAALTSSFTVQSLESSIRGPDDLAGRKVGVLAQTTSEAEAEELHADTVPFEKIDQAYEALHRGELEAVVYDAPNMQYYVENHGQGDLTLLGQVFETQHYGMVVREEDPRLESIDRALLRLEEAGETRRIRHAWFGSD